LILRGATHFPDILNPKSNNHSLLLPFPGTELKASLQVREDYGSIIKNIEDAA